MTELIVYNNNIALVKEKKKVNLAKGRNTVKYSGVPASLNPDSIFLSGNDDLVLRQYSYKHEALTPANLIKNSLGRSVRLINKDCDVSTDGIKATVAGNESGVVFSVDGKMLVGFDGQVVFDVIPETMSVKPEIVLDVDAENDNDGAEINLSYLAGGLSWKTHYTAKLDVSEKFDLLAFVSVTNNSGASFNNADISLVAGDVNAKTSPVCREEASMAMGMQKQRYSAEKSLFSEAANSGVAGDVYHRYFLNEKIDLADKETKRVLLFDRKNIPYEKEYVVELTYNDMRSAVYKNINPTFNAVFCWKKDDDFVLPKGVVRGYAVDGDNVVFVGQDNIGNTAPGERTVLNFGKVFDVAVDMKYVVTVSPVKDNPPPPETEKNPLPRETHFDVVIEAVVRNAKKKDTVVVFRKLFHPLVNITTENYESVTGADGKREWRIPVTAGGESKLVVRYSWNGLK